LPAPGFDISIVDDETIPDVEGVVVHHADGRTTVLPNPAGQGQVLTSAAAGDPEWTDRGVPVFVQATQPVNPTAPSLWIPLDETGEPLPADQWQVFV
jgi:hypothetical protein